MNLNLYYELFYKNEEVSQLVAVYRNLRPSGPLSLHYNYWLDLFSFVTLKSAAEINLSMLVIDGVGSSVDPFLEIKATLEGL